MRRFAAVTVALSSLVAVVGGVYIVWRRNPRIGTAFMNTVVNPSLVRRGLVGGGGSEIGTLEHVGRRSGIRRLTPVHPEPTLEGFRIVVPLGSHSQWARNVLAAGHCRLQLHDVIYDLDEPTLISAGDADDLPSAVRGAMSAAGFQYLTLRTFEAKPGTLEPMDAAPAAAVPSDLGHTSDVGSTAELVSSVV
jgi:deazaflavin-dependent oxidoreductase (nitroreductase family)